MYWESSAPPVTAIPGKDGWAAPVQNQFNRDVSRVRYRQHTRAISAAHVNFFWDMIVVSTEQGTLRNICQIYPYKHQITCPQQNPTTYNLTGVSGVQILSGVQIRPKYSR